MCSCGLSTRTVQRTVFDFGVITTMNNRRKFRYIKIKEEEPKKEAVMKKKNSNVSKNIGHALTVIGTTVSAMLLIFVIMMCIVVTIVTVYILDFADNGFDLNLRDAETQFTTMIYGYDEEGHEVELKRIAIEQNRFWVDYEDISPHLIHAVIATEDKRFYEHEGVDWRRTIFSLGANVLNSSRAGEGGSTITQQLIKNLTGDDEISWERKLREIFRALSLEKKYTKTDILESYLNNIGWGGMNYGVGAAAQQYFGKEAKDLDIAEAAILASMIKNPRLRSPYADLENCRENQLNTLYYMYEQGYINTEEYENAIDEQVQFARTVYGDAFGYIDPRSTENNTEDDDDDDDDEEEVHEAYRWNEYTISQDWYVDAALVQVYEDYAALKGISYTSAQKEICNGGYKIYVNEDMRIQKIIDEKYKDPYFVLYSYDPSTPDDELLQSAFVIMDYTGTVLGIAGGLGDKPGDNCWNRATMSTRAPGSTMKPISAYSMAIETNNITYSTMVPDKGIKVYGEDDLWPTNIGGGYTGELQSVWYAVRVSMNTVAVRVAKLVGVTNLYNQLVDNLGITTLVPSNDEALSPIPLGALTNGVKLYELTAAYQIFGNGGVYYEPKMYSKVIDSQNNVVLEQNFYGNQAISSDTAWITNRLLRTVITNPGTYVSAASLGNNVEVVGKTGTSNDGKNLMFVGLTPNFVAADWLGVDNGMDIDNAAATHKHLAEVWHDIMAEVEDTSAVQIFNAEPSVVERQFCSDTGLLASTNCPNTDIGYYRKDNLPDFCSGKHELEIQKIWDMWNAIDENDGTLPENYTSPESFDTPNDE